MQHLPMRRQVWVLLLTCLAPIAICSGLQDTVDPPYALRGIERRSHGHSYGFNPHHGTLDDDRLDEWGTVSETVDNLRYRWVEEQPFIDNKVVYAGPEEGMNIQGSYNNRIKYTEGNIAHSFPNSNPGAVQTSATQSSKPAWAPDAGAAIDGNTDSWWESNSCTHTNRETDPWWRVDLGEERTVTEIRIFNLAGHQRYQMTDIEVLVGDGTDAGDKRCGQRNTLITEHDAFGVTPANNHGQEVSLYDEEYWVEEGGNIRISCAASSHDERMNNNYAWRDRGRRGRYVTVRVKGSKKVLHLCEVQVFGTLQSEPGMDQGYQAGSKLEKLAQGGGLPIDPCSADVLLHGASLTRLCHE